MQLRQFQEVRTAIQAGAHPGTIDDLRLVEGNLRLLLLDSGLFDAVEVEHTDDQDQLVIALCRFRPWYTARDVAQRLEEIWADRVRYPFWEAHAFLTDEGHVQFQAATRVGPQGHYVTVHLVAQRAWMPRQRTASR